MNKQQFALDIYMSKMFKIIMYFIPLLALGAGINFSVLKLFFGKYEDVSWIPLIIFDFTNILYCILGLYFARNCEDDEGNLKSSFVYVGKLIISVVIIIQWNYISYMIPSRGFWAFFALFIFVSVFFLDSKYVIHTVGIVDLSMFISWIVKPNELLPIKDEFFGPEIILRCILITFISIMMFLITFIVEKLLVKELENIAEYDSLTLLRNRRSLGFKMDEAISDYEKSKNQFCFLMCDIDDFKVVNDTYGHPFGDIVLRNIAKLFIVHLGETNNLFRYGGEEICAILYTNIEDATRKAEQLRLAIQNQIHTSGKIKVSVTMSMGIMEYRSGLSKEDVIKISDSNLYYAKSHGKNKIIS